MREKKSSEYLRINTLTSTPQLAHKLPPALAQRYHALPVSEESGRITVAMANPNDAEARQAILDILGAATCVVQTDEKALERSQRELWPELYSRAMQTLVWAPPVSNSDDVVNCAHAFETLLGANLIWFETSANGRDAYVSLADEARLLEVDLVICPTPILSPLERLRNGPVARTMVRLIPSSILFAQALRLPIKRMLLIILGEASDEEAVTWTIRLARLSGAFVTILPVVIPPPFMYASLKPNPSELLRTDCSLGRRLRKAARRLVDWEIDGKIQLREELPEEQIRCELEECIYDLIVVPSEPQGCLKRLLVRELIPPLIDWVDKPVLVAKPRIEKYEN